MRDLWGNSKHTNIHIIGVPDGEEREKGVENVSDEITAENFPNLKKEIDIQVEEAKKVSSKMNPNRPTPRHIIIIMKKLKREF